ncbi:NADAR family protein [Candidatus Uabimicrobium sp. HlEnr_7]|uniref:NADAR family protein n=1 Tax=Candidatus Uabimicrobium helgolandensis TaxID=3095367 RepID=UPI003555C3CB
MEIIKFYSVVDEYGEFSNFAKYPIKMNGVTWPTTEHYFQAMKMVSPQNQKKIRNAKTAMQAARIGRDRKNKRRRDWESCKVEIMRKAVLAKFSQYQELKELLLSTHQAKIVEHTVNDDYWGDGGDGKGKNMLGRILMQVRDILAKEER